MKNIAHQLTLFDIPDENGVNFKPMHVNKSTFKGGLSAPVHNWFRLTPSFGPPLVDYMLDVMGYQPGQKVLDPFSGACTTQIQCKLMGIPSYGFEINPLLHFVGTTSLNWDLDRSDLEKEFENIEKLYLSSEKYFLSAQIDELPIPQIHNPFRWWREDVLRKMLCLKKTILSIDDKSIKDFFILAFACCLVPDLTNITLGRLQLHFINRDDDNIDVLESFKQKAKMMIDDIGKVFDLKDVISKIYYCDSTCLDNSVCDFTADYIVTSPPYPNRYSYVWNTRPHLYFFEFFSKPKQAADLDKKTIGGTWGTATSCLQKGIIKPLNDTVGKAAGKVVSDIREKDNLMANYVMKYFNMLAAQLLQAENILSDNSKAAYVVGNSWIKGIYVNTDEILQSIFLDNELSYKSAKVERFRRRHSGKDLYESIVFASKI